jgi:hypothetical protein
MIKLYDHYKTSGDQARMEWIKKKIVSIVKGSAEEQSTLNYLSK